MQCPHDICGVGQVAIAILPDDVILAIFSFYGEANRPVVVDTACARVSKMAAGQLWLTSAPAFGASLQLQKAGEEVIGYLATPSHCHNVFCP